MENNSIHVLGTPGTSMMKLFEYKNVRFSITVKFATSQEKHINGRTFNEIAIDDIDDNMAPNCNVYHKFKRVEAFDIIATVNMFIANAKEWVDELDKSRNVVTELQQLDFK
jgi:hypothetical protein